MIDPNQKFRTWPARACNSAPMPTGVYLQEYMRLGGPNGPMGCPIQVAVSIPGVAHGGRVQFQNGAVVTNDDVWPGGALAAYQDGPNIVVDWAVKVGSFAPGYNYDKFIVRWNNVADARSQPQQVDVPAHLDQPEWGDTHLRSEGNYAIGWSGTSTATIQVSVEGCDNPTYNLLKPDPTKSRCLQGWMPAAQVLYMSNWSLLPGNDFLFIDFNRMHIEAPKTVEESQASLRARAATAIVQAACSTLPYTFYANDESYRNGLMAKMLFADYFYSDTCPGRTVNNRDEVNQSLRNQRLLGDENAGSTFDGISLPKFVGDAANLCGPQYQGQYASCPPYRKGEYDVMLTGYAALLSKYGSALAGDVYQHVLNDLLTKKGPFNPADLQVSITGVVGSETENHILQIEVGQYLTNQLMFAQTHDGRYNNATNGMNQFMANFLHDLLKRDFLEYNARPYQDYALTALQYLYSFAADTDDAPRGGFSSHAVKLAAEMVLDYESAKVAVSTDDGRRIAPYRRKAKYDQLSYSASAHDLLGSDGDGQFPRMLFLAGTGIDQLTQSWTPTKGLAMGNYSWQMINAIFSSYRIPPLILDEMITRTDRNTYASFHHSADEIYFRSGSFMINAGGQPAPTLYPYQADKRTVAALAGAAVGVVGSPLAAPIAAAVADLIQVGDDDARGVAVPTALLPGGVYRDRDSLLRFEGTAGQDSTNMCVAPNFACGQALQIPGSFRRPNCWSSRPGKTPGSKWEFFNFSGDCSLTKPLGYYVAVWYQMAPQGNSQRADGFFEVYERSGGEVTQTARVGSAEQPKGPARGREAVARPTDQRTDVGQIRSSPALTPPQSQLDTISNSKPSLTFLEFVSAVMEKNGNKAFSTGINEGANAYMTVEGAQIAFQVNPGRTARPAQGLVAGNFLSTDAQGRIIIHNSRAGEELILDDTNPANPVRTVRTGLPTNRPNRPIEVLR